MINIVTGLIATVALLVFFVFYLLRIGSWVLAVIAVAVLVLAVADILLNLRAGRGSEASGNGGG